MNTYNEVISLIQPIVSSSGETETTRDIFVAVTSVGFNEFYRATQEGFTPEIKFTMADYLDYNNEPIVSYNSKRYNVIRSYRIGTRELELTCERVNASGSI